MTSVAPLPGTQAARPIRTVALAGPPNSGKSTFFNLLTGLRQKTANFPGVTVEQRTGVFRDDRGRRYDLVDLPGIYSLDPKSEDERVTVDVLHGRMPGTPRPDAVILVLDSTSLRRHLVLAAEVIALGLPTLVVLNMADVLHRHEGTVDALALARELGTPVVLASAALGQGVEAVELFLQQGSAAARPTVDLPVLQDVRACAEWACDVGRRSSYQPPLPSLWTSRLDRYVLHPIFGPLIFAAVVLAVFQGMFRVAQPLADSLQWLLQSSAARLSLWMPRGWLQSLLLNGVWKGVGSVLIFLPQIMVLFLLLGLLEDSGYLARAAVIADRTMARIGLNGKAFIPLLSAYACAVPAIMATRTIENRRDRIATILIAPFMTCSARLPVYTMIIAAFVPERRLLGVFLGTRAAALLGLYMLGFLAAMFTARVLKSSILRSEGHPFILELPAYRWPTFRGLGLRLFERGQAFLLRAGTVILAVSVVLWILTYFPTKNGEPPALGESAIAHAGQAIQPAIAPLGFDWKIGVGLLTSVAAREVIVSTLGALNGVDPEAQKLNLQEVLRREMSPGAAAALLIFFAFAMQCTSTLAVVRRETNSWRWPALQFCYMTSLAYVSAFLANRAVTFWLR